MMGIIYTNTKPDYLPPVLFKRSLLSLAVFAAIRAKRQGGTK